MAIAVASGPSLAQESPSQELSVGLVPEINVFDQVERFEPLAAYLSEETGRDVRLTMLSSYGNIIQRIADNDVDAAFLGSLTAAVAITQLRMEPLVRPVNADGTAGYKGLLIARRDSGIGELEDTAGKTLALVDPATTAGYLYPLAYFRRQGIDELETHFSRVEFLGSHDAVIQAVRRGDSDIGAAKNTVFEQQGRLDPQLAEELRIFASSLLVPSNGLMVRESMNETLKTRIETALLTMDQDPAAATVLARLGFQRFVPVEVRDYANVFEIARQAGIDLSSFDFSTR